MNKRSSAFYSALREEMGDLLKTQGKLTAYELYLDAAQVLAVAVLSGDSAKTKLAKTGFESALTALTLSQVLTEQLGEVPEASMGQAAEAFKVTPVAFAEAALVETLLAEIHGQESVAGLKAWYKSERGRLEGLVTHDQRDRVFQAIRDRGIELANLGP